MIVKHNAHKKKETFNMRLSELKLKIHRASHIEYYT